MRRPLSACGRPRRRGDRKPTPAIGAGLPSSLRRLAGVVRTFPDHRQRRQRFDSGRLAAGSSGARFSPRARQIRYVYFAVTRGLHRGRAIASHCALLLLDLKVSGVAAGPDVIAQLGFASLADHSRSAVRDTNGQAAIRRRLTAPRSGSRASPWRRRSAAAQRHRRKPRPRAPPAPRTSCLPADECRSP